MSSIHKLGRYTLDFTDVDPAAPYLSKICYANGTFKCECHRNILRIPERDTLASKGNRYPWMGHELVTKLTLAEFLKAIPVRCVTLLPEFQSVYGQVRVCATPPESLAPAELARMLAAFGPKQRPAAPVDTGRKRGNIEAVMAQYKIDGATLVQIFELMDQKGVTRERPADDAGEALAEFQNLRLAYALVVLQRYIYNQEESSMLSRAMHKTSTRMYNVVKAAWVNDGWRGACSTEPKKPVKRSNAQYRVCKTKPSKPPRARVGETAAPATAEYMAGGQFTIALR